MKIEIDTINNGYLVRFVNQPTSSDPLAQRAPHGTTFADTKEAVCGLIAEQVLKLPDPNERTT